MKKITLGELHRQMNAFNTAHPEKESEPCLSGVIVYKQSNFTKPYSETSRSYRVYSNSRAFQNGKIANSMFGYCLDGTDDGVRLDWYNWEVEFCYMEV